MNRKYKNILITTLLIFFTVLALDFLNLRFLVNFHSFINDKAFTLKENAPIDTNIVLVNYGPLNRRNLARLIEKIAAAHPKVIGISACLDRNKKTPNDSLLVATLNKHSNIVLLIGHDSSCVFTKGPLYTHLSLIKDPDEVIRSFAIDSNAYFEEEIVRIFNPQKYETLKMEHQAIEPINYSGNIDRFFALDEDQVMDGDFNEDLFKNKIVLVGFLGTTLSPEVRTLDAAVYTPLNEKLYHQKSTPDMYTLVVSANIISMILKGDFIEKVPIFISLLIILCTIIFNLLIGSLILEKSFWAYGLFAITLTFIEIFAAGLLIVWLLNSQQQMLYLQILPIALILSFILFFIFFLKFKPGKKQEV